MRKKKFWKKFGTVTYIMQFLNFPLGWLTYSLFCVLGIHTFGFDWSLESPSQNIGLNWFYAGWVIFWFVMMIVSTCKSKQWWDEGVGEGTYAAAQRKVYSF